MAGVLTALDALKGSALAADGEEQHVQADSQAGNHNSKVDAKPGRVYDSRKIT